MRADKQAGFQRFAEATRCTYCRPTGGAGMAQVRFNAVPGSFLTTFSLQLVRLPVI
jgi:hypothetical protein